MRVLTIGSDRKLFEEGSAVRARAVEYAGLFDELHIIVFTRKFQNLKTFKLTTNSWVYPTRSWSRWLYVFDAVRLGKRIIRDSKFVIRDSVLSGQDPFECGLAAYKLAKRFKLPLHLQIHTDPFSPYFAKHSFLNRLRIRIARRIIPAASGIRVVSQRIKDSLVESRITPPERPASGRAGNHESRIEVLPIFTDLEKFKNAMPTLDLKQRYPQWHFIILMVARLSPEKNVGFALDVLHEIVKKYPQLGMVIVGVGPLEGSLKSKVKSLKLEANVVFEGMQNDVISYYKTANIFLQTSLYEGFGLALLEAVASGCPAVSSDVGIAPELLNFKGHSFVCPVNDLDCFVQTISKLIEDNQLRTFFSLEIAPSVILPFSQSKDEYLQAYKHSLEDSLMQCLE